MRTKIMVALAGLVLALGFNVGVAPAPAMANAACASNRLCLLPCFLAESCNPWFNSAVSAGCYPTMAGGFNHLTYSVKNQTSKNITTYHTTNCSSSGGTSTLFAHTSGDMNNEWAGAGIKSFRVPS